MEALMDSGSLPFRLTAEDRRTIKEWRWSLAAVYGAVLLVLALMFAAGPYTKTDVAKSGGETAFSPGAIADQLPVR
jgi:hypothetical protein